MSNQKIYQLPVTVIAELARFPMTLTDIQNMMVDGFIPIGEKLESSLWVNNQKKFVGEFGEVSGFRAVQIKVLLDDNE